MSRYSSQRRTFISLAVAGLLSLGVAGCKGPVKFQGSDISGTHLGHDMAMVDSSGTLRTLADYKGKVLVVYFGYTHCPDVCPTAMAELAQTMTLLKGDAQKVQVIMITVDPQRDTGAIMVSYAKAFNPNFVGLTGSPDQLHKTAQSFKAYYAKASGGTPDTYTMDHSAFFLYPGSNWRGPGIARRQRAGQSHRQRHPAAALSADS